MQPSQDVLTVSRRPLDVEDYIDIARRHKSWIIGPAFAALVIAVVVAHLWPDTYISTATIQVVPPQVPERYVSSNVNSEMSQRINSMAQQILSRESLTNLVMTLDLYKRERDREPMADVVERMKTAINVTPVGSIQLQSQRMPISAFRVSFKYSDRFKAQQVNAALVTRFVDENVRQLQSQSAATTSFLKDQWEDARKTLEKMEKRMTDFRIRNAGRLPDQMTANLQSLQALQSQLMGINEQISRAGQEKLLLESQLRVYKEQLRNVGQGTDELTTQLKSERLQQTDKDITSLENYIASLRERYKDDHPDVKAAERQLAMLRSRRDALMKEEEQKSAAAPSPQAARINYAIKRGSQQLETAIQALESQIQAKNLEIEDKTKLQARLNGLIDSYNQRIQATPATEGEYAEITRDYTLAKQNYDELNKRKTQSEIATNLENRGQGERLSLLEAASLPETPAEPDRLLWIGAGLAIGIMAGVFIAGAREMKDTSLKNLKDARAYTGLPVLGTVPLLENDLVVRRKRRLAWLAWSAACIIGVLAMTSSIYYYYYVARV